MVYKLELNLFMKKTIAFLLLMGVFFNARSQDLKTINNKNFERGTFLSSLYFSGGFNTGSQVKVRNWNLTPEFGYFAVDNLAVGAFLGYDQHYYHPNEEIIPSTPKLDYRVITPGLFLRYYAPVIKVKPYVQLAGGYSFYNGTSSDAVNHKISINSSDWSASVGGGILFPLGQSMSLSVDYRKNLTRSKVITNPSSTNNFKLGLSVRF